LILRSAHRSIEDDFPKIGLFQQPASGTKVSCRLEQTISSATAEEGQQVQLSVTEDVKVNDVVVIPQNSTVVGTVITAREKQRMGRAGKLDFSVEKVRALDGEFIPLRYTVTKRAGNSAAVSTGVLTAGAAVLFWPAAPFFLLRKGKDITINKGIVLETFTDQDHTLKNLVNGHPAVPVSAAATAAAPAAPAPAAPALGGRANVTITSAVAGAEIEIDGAYVGSTPTMRPVPAGSHRITVRSGAKIWEKTMDIPSEGTISINATPK